MKAHPEHLVEGNAMNFISDNGGEEYNLCHCKSPSSVRSMAAYPDIGSFTVWSNFEVADMDFWRAPAYTAYVDYLEASGGFYYEVRASLLSLRLIFTPRVIH
jgi:alpha 1,2-mannosyltransferase